MERPQRSPGYLVLLTLGLGLGACKEETTDVSGYVDAWSRRVCDAVVDCNCDYPGGSDYDHCRSQLGVEASTLAELNDVEGLRFDGDCADRQISEVHALGCGVFEADPDASCERPCKVWLGPVSEGGTCTSVNGFDNCHQGLVCDAGVCVDPCDTVDFPSIGEACSTQFGCEEGAWCDDVTAPLLPVCAALPGAGEACLGPENGFACNVDLVCDPTDPDAPVCMTLPSEGEECPVGVCAEDLFCDGTMTPSVCATLPGLGDPCPLGVCAAPNQCEEGSCVAPRPQVCGLYGGVPEGLDPTGNDSGVGPVGTSDTGDMDTGELETGGDGSCCMASPTPGCTDAPIAMCVCAIAATCCTDAWNEQCVELVEVAECGVC